MHPPSAFVTHGCFAKVAHRKLFVIERQEHKSASRQINRADPAEALRSSPDASVSSGSQSRCCLAPMPLVCETASVPSGSADHHDRIATEAAALVLASRRAFGKHAMESGCRSLAKRNCRRIGSVGVLDFVQPGRDQTGGPGGCSITRATATCACWPGRVRPSASTCATRRSAPASHPSSSPKRNSESIAYGGRTADKAASLEHAGARWLIRATAFVVRPPRGTRVRRRRTSGPRHSVTDDRNAHERSRRLRSAPRKHNG